MNRSYVYAFDRAADGRIVRVVALSESEANIPLIYRILASVNPKAAKSIVFDSDEKIAITASYDMGLSRLSAFFIQLPEEYRERCDKVLSFLRQEKNRRMYIHLECAEIYEMDDDADDIAAKNAKLIEELSHIEDEMKKAIKRVVYDGDVFDVRELEAEYWSNTLALMPEMDDDDAEETRENPFLSDVFAKIRETKEKKENAGEDDDDEVSEVDKTGLFGDVFSAIREYEGEDADDVDDKKPWQSSAFMSERTQLRQFVQSHPESKKWKKFNATVNDPELYKQKDTGKDCGVFALKEGVITALPIEPKNMYSLNDDTEIEEWRLFLQDKEGKTRAVMEYYYALEMLKKLSANSRNFILGEKDMYLITSPLTTAEMDTLIRQSGASFSPVTSRRGNSGEDGGGDEWVNNVEVVKTPYVEQLSEKKSLFTFIFLVMSFLNAALFSSGRINMGAFEQFSLFLRSVALSLALAAGSYAVGYAILSFISGRLRSKGRKLLSFIAVLCCIDLVLRVVLLAFLRDSVDFAATPTAFSFGTLFALFDVWQRHIDDEHIAPLGKIWRILGVFFAVLLFVCWHFFGIVIGSLIVAGVALVVFALICTANAISDALAKKFHAEKPIQRLQKNVWSVAKSWKVRAVLISSVASFAFFVHWLDFKGGAIVWAVFAFLVGLLVYFLREAFNLFGEIIGDKFSRDGVDVDGVDDEEMGGNMPEIIHIGALQTPCGVFSLTQGEAIALPMNPKSIFSLSDTTIYFWRLFVYDASGAQIADLDYERALWWLKATADEKAGEGVKELEDGFEYVVLHGLSMEALASIIDAVKADAETDDVNYLRLKGERSEDAEEEETAEELSANDDMSFETLGKEGVLCGVFNLFAGSTACFPVDPRALYRGEAQGGKAADCALWRMRLYDEEHFEIADLEFYHAMWWLKTRAPDGVIALDARENLIVGEPLTSEELFEMKETVEAGAGDEDAEYLRLKAEKKEKGTSFWELSAQTDSENDGYDDGGKEPFDPKNPGSSKYRNMDIHMAEANEYTREDTGAVCAGFVLKEDVATALPIDPDEFYSIGSDGSDDSDEGEKVDNWRLFLIGADGSIIADLWYGEAMAALQSLAVYGEKFLIGEKDGYAVTTPLTAEEMKEIAAKTVGYDGESDAICPSALQLANGDWRAYFAIGADARSVSVLPLDPEIFEQERDNGEIYPFDEYRLLVFAGEATTPHIDYKKAMKWLPKIVDAKNICKCVLPDDYEYRAVKNLSTQELQALIEAVDADYSDDDDDNNDTDDSTTEATVKQIGDTLYYKPAPNETVNEIISAIVKNAKNSVIPVLDTGISGEKNSFEEGISRKTVLSTAYISGVAFETVRLSGDEKHPNGVEMLKAVLTRAQSDCGGEYVFSESAQLGEDIDDDRYPIDSFNFYWAIQYCNALSLTCHLEPCYSIDGETNPDAWGTAPYHEYNSFTKKWSENSENEAFFARVVCNFDANGWRLPTLEECRRAANTDGIEKETIYEIKQLWIWSDDVPRHSALVSSDWKSGELTAEAQEPQEVRPSYSIRICRNADIGSSLPLSDSFGAERAESDAQKTQDDEKAFDYFQGAAQTGKKSKGTWRSLLIPFSIVVGGLILFWLTGSIAVCYGVGVLLFLTRGFWSACDEKEEKKLRRESSSDEENTPIREAVERITTGKTTEYTHEQAAAILEYMKKMYSMPAVRIRAEDRTEKPMLSMTASKFGGLPYWTRGEEYPTGENGEKLYLLAQINFADVPKIPDFPTHGLLQIFIANDDMYGWDAIEHGTKTPQKNWRVVWRDVVSPSLAMSAAELSAMGVRAAQKTGADGEGISLPIQNEFGLTFEKIESHINPSCDGFGEAVKEAVEALGLPVFAGWDYEWFSDVDYQEFYGDGRVAPHQIGGHPQFTQGEMRPEGDILLLFQMASEWIATGGDDDDEKNAIMWGDMGIANFFLSREDLRSRDFSRVLYNWDCY